MDLCLIFGSLPVRHYVTAFSKLHTAVRCGEAVPLSSFDEVGVGSVQKSVGDAALFLVMMTVEGAVFDGVDVVYKLNFMSVGTTAVSVGVMLRPPCCLLPQTVRLPYHRRAAAKASSGCPLTCCDMCISPAVSTPWSQCRVIQLRSNCD